VSAATRTRPTADLDDASDVGELAVSLRFSIARLARRLRQQDRTGMGPTLTATLATVAREGSPTHGEIAAHEGLSAPTITAVVDKLVALGHVERHTDARDRRVVRVQITPSGVEQLDAVRARRTEWIDAQLRALSARDRARLAAAAPVLARLAAMPDDGPSVEGASR
jgi:DNA-binding MarR family transcriptional regulator